MGKHEIIVKHLLRLTRSRTPKNAMKNWDVDDRINLPSRTEKASCELCGTRFRQGAVVSRKRSGKLRRVKITIGGTCLVSLLEQQFSKPRELLQRRSVTQETLKERYHGLADPGTWKTWVYEHAPPKLLDLAVRLFHVGALRRVSDMNKLIAFHDQNRKYPAEAILPYAVELRNVGVRVPKTLTIDRSREIINGLTKPKWLKIIEQRSSTYFQREKSDYVANWDSTYRQCNTRKRRIISALARISDLMHADQYEGWDDWIADNLHYVTLQLPTPRSNFVWNLKYGLCLLAERLLQQSKL